MKTRMASALLIAVIAILLFFTANTAALVVEKDIGTLTSEADTILTGTVTDLQSQWEEGKIFTYVTISASEYIKGAKGGEVTIKVPGGTVGDISCYVSDAPAFEKGEEVLVFLREKDDYFDVVGWYQGKYNIEGEEVLGTDLSVDDFTALFLGESEIIVNCEQENAFDYGDNCNWPISQTGTRCCCWCPDPTGAHAWGHVMDLGTIVSDVDVYFEIRPGAGDAGCITTGYMYYSTDGSNWSLFWSQPNLQGWNTYSDTVHISDSFRYIRANTNGCSVDWSTAKVRYTPTPAITSITPDYGPAKAKQLGSDDAAPDSTRVTLSGSNFGTSPGYVKFWRVGTTYHDAYIESWSDTRIVCRVPGRVSSYNKTDGSGNVHVVTSGGAISNTARFHLNYSYNGGKWAENSATPPNTRVTYKVNPNTGDCLDELGAVQRAASTWNNAGANFSFVYDGATTKTSVGADGENSIIWVNRDTGSIATAWTYWRATDPKTILEADIEFNDLVYNWNSDTTCPTGRMDAQNIATHELGHWLSLADLYGTTDSEKTMYGFAATCETKKRTVEPDDIAGIRDIYGEVIPKPTISIYTDKTSYTAGEKMHLGLDVKNPLDSAQRVSLNIYLETPTGGKFTLIDKIVTLPPKLNYSNPHFWVKQLPSIPAGTYTWHAILDDPLTGKIICEDTAPWKFVSTSAPTEDITEILEQTTVVIDFGE